MLTVSWLFFKPPLPEAATGTAGETLEGRVVEVLSDEEMPVAGQAQPVQRVLVEITLSSWIGWRSTCNLACRRGIKASGSSLPEVNKTHV